jgi:CubicO group peptidase (beta-lactamase class C family)
MTAAAVALLVERGRIDLDAPVQQYVPAYPHKQWALTTRHLLGDVGGVHRIRGDANDQMPRGRCRRVTEAVETFAAEPLLFEPGTSYRFSTSGWILLSAVIEGAAKESFASFVSRELFAPLGMTRTALESTDNDADYGCFFGAGAFLSTPSDLVRFGSAMVVPRPSDTRARGLLKPKTIALFQTPLQLTSGASTGFALGWKVDRITIGGRQAPVVRHRATFIGGGASLSLLPQQDLVVAVLSSPAHTARMDPFVLQVAEAFASIK